MEKAKVYLFTSPTCPHCPPAKEFIHKFKKIRKDFTLIELSTMSNEGRRKAQKFNVMSTPTFVIKGPNYPLPIGLRGLQSEKTMNKFLDMSFGIEPEEEPGFLSKIKKGFKIGKFKIKF